METEIFIPINDFPNYSISNFGNVKNNRTGKNLKQVFKKIGYFVVTLCEKGEKKQKTIHFLIANEFIPNPLNKQLIDHVDGNRQNNTLLNLRWATSEQNNSNRKKRENTSSIYKGVSFKKNIGKWAAQIKRVHLGYFEDEIEAAKVYNQKAVETFGEYAKLNEISDN